MHSPPTDLKASTLESWYNLPLPQPTHPSHKPASQTAATASSTSSFSDWYNSVLPHTAQPPAATSISTLKSHYTFIKRKRATPTFKRPLKSAKAQDAVSAVNTLTVHCCDSLCVQHFSVMEVLSVRRAFVDVSEQQVTELMVAELRPLFNPTTKHIGYRLRNRAVCRSAWQLIHGVSKSKLDHCIALLRNDSALTLSGASAATRSTDRSEQAYAWMSLYFEAVCDQLNASNWVLPAHHTWKELYQEFAAEMKEEHHEGVAVASFSTFQSVRRAVGESTNL